MGLINLKLGSIAGLVLIAVLSFSLTGCKKEETVTPPPQPAKPQYVVKVIPRPDTSEEMQRVYYYQPDGVTLYKLEIQYRKNGRTQIQFYRTDGSIEEVQEFHPFTTKVKSSAKLARDGKTKVEESTYRVQGGLESTTKFNADGSSSTVRFRADGKRVVSESVKAVDGTRTSTFYHKDGKTMWAKTVESNYGDSKVETYREDGTRDVDRDSTSNSLVYTVYGADGKAKYRQTWSGYRSPYYRNYNLEKVEEFAEDGSTVKRVLEFERYGNRNLRTATDMVNGKKARVRTFRYYDGTLDREEIFAEDGTSKSEDHPASENKTESFDPAMKNEPRINDPLVDGASHL